MTNFNWKNKKVLITGVYGFVGSNLCKSLIQEGATVYGLHKNNKENSLLRLEKIDQFNSLSFNNLNLENVTELITDKEIEICFHLAAQVEVKKAEEFPYYTFENNFFLTLVLLEAFRNSKNLKSFIFTSTDKVYGEIEKSKLPYKETYNLNPKAPYEVSKSLCEDICKSYAENYNMPLIITRACNLYGPGQLNFSALIPSLILSSIKNEDFIPRSNGKLTRDYMYIGDWVDALKTICIYNINNKLKGEIFNFGTSEPKSVIDITELIYNKLNPSKTNDIINKFKNYNSKNEISNQSLDSSKAKKTFNFSSKTRIQDGIDKTIDWYKKFLK